MRYLFNIKESQSLTGNCLSHAAGAFIANWTLVGGSRTSLQSPDSSDPDANRTVPFIASLRATCSDGTPLAPLGVSGSSQRYSYNLTAPQSILTDRDAPVTTTGGPRRRIFQGHDLAEPSAGFRVIWAQ